MMNSPLKKSLLSIALLGASLSASANQYHGSLAGMSGAAFATGNYSEGVLLNPSLGAAYNPEKDDFALLLSAGAVLTDEDDFIDRADELAGLINDLEGSTELTEAQAEDLKQRLQDIDGDTAQVRLGASAVLAIPNDLVSLSFMFDAKGYISLTPDVAEDDLALIDEYVNRNPDSLNSELESSVTGRGAMVTEFGIALSKAITLDETRHLLIGVKPKRVEVESIVYSSTLADFDEDDFDEDQYTRTETATNVDLGLTYIDGKVRYGFVLNNVKEKEFATINADEPVRIERQMIGSLGYVSGHFKAEMALDLNAIAAIGLPGEVQLVRAGVEYSAWDWLRLRAGVEQDMKNTYADSYSLGVGIGAINMAYITGSEGTEGFALSGGFRF